MWEGQRDSSGREREESKKESDRAGRETDKKRDRSGRERVRIQECVRERQE